MAQLLVFMRDNTSPRPEETIREFKTDDPIAVAEDTHVWGRRELQFPFRVVSVLGDRSEWVYLLESEPVTARDVYPRSLIHLFRLRRAIQVEAKKIQMPFRRRRIHSVGLDGSITRKTMESV